MRIENSSLVCIFLAPQSLMADMYFTPDWEIADKVRSRLNDYQQTSFFLAPAQGEDAAEYAFDLTNNPSRQEERERYYGRGRSVSVGDVVSVDGSNWLCDKTGWIKL